MMELEAQISELAGRLRTAARISVLTGAGVSAASGVPTFRGPKGLWKDFSPQQLATAEAFRRDPRLVWEWYDWRRGLIAKCRPNAAHGVLARWSRAYPNFTLITQNVDGLHESAGTAGVICFHGSIWDVLCWDNCPQSPARWRDETVPLHEIPLRCPYCGGLARPGVVWFGEAIDPVVLERSTAATRCDVFLTIGTSALVYPAAGLAFEARSRGAYTVEINPEATPASDTVDLALSIAAEKVLPLIDKLCCEKAL